MPGISLDEFLEQNALEDPSFLKIDVILTLLITEDPQELNLMNFIKWKLIPILLGSKFSWEHPLGDILLIKMKSST